MVGEGGQPDRLYPPLELFGLVMSPKVSAIGSNMLREPKRCLHYHWGEFQIHAFHVMPSMDCTVSVMNLRSQKILL